ESELLAKLRIKPDQPLKFYREKGCQECRDAGYAGRLGIFEILIPDSEVKKLIDKKAASGEIRNCAISNGMRTLRDDGLKKLERGTTSLSELLRVTQE
ncbi:MAG: type II secretion system protein GspE, partial [Candidatus Omnitrophota bacterium]